MKKRKCIHFGLGMGLLAAFLLWTWAVCEIDVQQIGPNGTSVGFAAINAAFHEMTGVHMPLYIVTDWLGLVPICIVIGFGIMGMLQWIRRKRLTAVDRDILLLGVFYLTVIAAYCLFEYVIINYRPVLMNGNLEVSYPSSTTLLVLSVMPTAMLQLHKRIQREKLRWCTHIVLGTFTLFAVIGRLLSGVHWLTDIIGGCLLSGGLVAMYAAFENME